MAVLTESIDRSHSDRRKPLLGTAAAVWLPLLALPAVAFAILPSTAPRWVVMWLLAGTIYAGCKWLTWFGTRLPAATFGRKLAWWLAWPGMEAKRFLSSETKSLPKAADWAAALIKILLGTGLFVLAGKLISHGWMVMGAWTGMAGFILSLHCGLFHLLSCLWRSIGWPAEPLMDRPLASGSVSEFWGRRWNRAFRDLTYPAIFRPLASRHGSAVGALAVFAFSGLVHELVISVPAGGGYGLPTLYFLLQGLAVLVENRLAGNRTNRSRDWLGRLFAALVIAAPVPLLFHLPFIHAVVVPFLKTISP
jgi:hypothetical protein